MAWLRIPYDRALLDTILAPLVQAVANGDTLDLAPLEQALRKRDGDDAVNASLAGLIPLKASARALALAAEELGGDPHSALLAAHCERPLPALAVLGLAWLDDEAPLLPEAERALKQLSPDDALLAQAALLLCAELGAETKGAPAADALELGEYLGLAAGWEGLAPFCGRLDGATLYVEL